MPRPVCYHRRGRHQETALTQQQRSNGRTRPVKDPDYRPSSDPAAYWPLPAGQELTVCSRCSAVIPASERAQTRHRAHHETLSGLEDGKPR